MFATLSYLGAHWTLFVITTLSVVVLGALSWFLKNWKLAAAAIVLVVFGLAYQSSNMDGYKRRVNEDSQAQLSTLKNRLLALSITQAVDAQRATADAYLNSQLDTLSRETPPNAAACLDAAAARRVRAVSSAQPVAAPVPTRRPTKLLPWRSGRP